MKGIIVWCSVVVINIGVLLVLQFARKSRRVPVKDIFIAALISDIIVHLLIAVTSDIGKMIMWGMLTFPIVGIPSILVCFFTKQVYDRTRRNQVHRDIKGA